jgi:hypothetical protein
MKTDDLIKALAADSEHRGVPFTNAMVLAFGAAATAVAFAIWVGPRADIAFAVTTIRFPFKIFVVSALAIASIGLLLRSGRPGAKLLPWLAPAILALALLGFGVAGELVALPSNEWAEEWKGTNLFVCLAVIPSLAVVPFIAALITLRHGAPSKPTLAGAIAGLAAGAFAATLYALNCDNDSPLFVATWYPIAIGVVVATGALAGSRLLRW